MKDLNTFESTICQLLYIIHQKKDPHKETDASTWLQYCIPASQEVIFKSKDLYFIIPEDEDKAIKKQTSKVQKEENKVQAQVLEEQFADIKLVKSGDEVAFDEV